MPISPTARRGSHGYFVKQDPVARFWSKVDKLSASPCWIWTANTSKGYGMFFVGYLDSGSPRFVAAHRYAYELLVGPIPDEKQLDHVRERGCTTRACVNPAHLEPVTSRENILRGTGASARNARKTHCPQGHAYTPDNIYIAKTKWGVGRVCRTCAIARERRKREART